VKNRASCPHRKKGGSIGGEEQIRRGQHADQGAPLYLLEKAFAGQLPRYTTKTIGGERQYLARPSDGRILFCRKKRTGGSDRGPLSLEGGKGPDQDAVREGGKPAGKRGISFLLENTIG